MWKLGRQGPDPMQDFIWNSGKLDFKPVQSEVYSSVPEFQIIKVCFQPS
jgi:hypothetical protein